MQDFAFRTTPEIRLTAGASAGIGALLAARGCRRVALVTDAGLVEAGLTEAAEAGLAEAGLSVFRWSDVVADPPEAKIEAAVEACRSEGVDGVAGLGGGSPMDTAKLVAALVGHEQSLTGCYGIDRVQGARLPLVLCPTTAGTGSEVTPIAIVTTGMAEKAGVVAPQLLPDAAVLDPALTTGLPAPVTAATGIDAMVHAIEAYTSRHRKNPLSDMLAREALARLGAHVETACLEPENLEARAAMLYGATLAGMAFANAPVAAVHALAYPLGGHFQVPHGLSNALVLAHVLAYNRAEAEGMYAELAPLVFPELAANDNEMRVTGLIDGLAALGPRLGLPERLSELGVEEHHLAMLADDAMKQERLLINNPREMTREAAEEIYAAAL